MTDLEKGVYFWRVQHVPFTQIAKALDLTADAILEIYGSAVCKEEAFLTALESEPWYQTEIGVQFTTTECQVLRISFVKKGWYGRCGYCAE